MIVGFSNVFQFASSFFAGKIRSIRTENATSAKFDSSLTDLARFPDTSFIFFLRKLVDESISACEMQMQPAISKFSEPEFRNKANRK